MRRKSGRLQRSIIRLLCEWHGQAPGGLSANGVPSQAMDPYFSETDANAPFIVANSRILMSRVIHIGKPIVSIRPMLRSIRSIRVDRKSKGLDVFISIF
jgi:hypothetical protein